MQALRNASLLVRLVLVWFALSLGAAVASPLIKPGAMELVCSGGGAVKLLVQNGDDRSGGDAHTLDCPLCVSVSAPPAAAPATSGGVFGAAHFLPGAAADPLNRTAAAPMPARGPPALTILL